MKVETFMTIREALMEASVQLENSGSPWLDATVLLSHICGQRRELILASFPDDLCDEHYQEFIKIIKLRREGHPVAYLTGKKEFFGRDFWVREGILCPRPDTEILVEEALSLIENRHYNRIHDLCTGSGCIALSLALEEPKLRVSASDISVHSEEVFYKNRETLQSPPQTEFIRTSLLETLKGPFDMIVSNPPYLTTDETVDRMKDGWKEPSLALDGGADGLDLIRIIIPEALPLLSQGGCLMIEAASSQMEKMKELMKKAEYTEIRILQDLAYRDRVIVGIKP
ncbi:MAG: protein-(glutamine-N5) methyltransferase, release factor-specific [Spirochaetaceae bacterium 4572_59]|nr:MAG: protein-(glutamine-N5) methyltransferase, release factor-specific [Spirochaetaceae bacterium 4572_59]